MNSTEYYRDFYGCTACIRTYKNGTARLTMSLPNGRRFLNKLYSTYRGAKIAMTRGSDGWERRYA